MSFCCDHGLRRAAKRHHCYYCNERIEVGERYGYRTGAADGDFWTMHYHPECAAEADSDCDFDYECFEPGEMTRPMTAFDPCI